MSTFSIVDYCDALTRQISERPTEGMSPSSQSFLQALQLPRMHPFCTEGFDFAVADIPPMGTLLQDVHESRLEALVSFLYMHLPALLSFADLWVRLMAGLLAPLGLLLLLRWNWSPGNKFAPSILSSIAMILTVAFSLVWMTDSMYVLEFGPVYGCILFIMSLLLSLRLSLRCNQRHLQFCLAGLLGLALSLCFRQGRFQFGNPDDVDIRVDPGLYYSRNNTLIRRMVELWPKSKYTYSKPTPWMWTGDARTGLPFFLYSLSVDQQPSTRVFLNVSDGECLALDIYFPLDDENDRIATSDYDKTRTRTYPPPLYLILHGVNGGSNEEYVKDLVYRATRKGSTVVVMVSRGLMDLPIRGWNIFHAARLTDVHETASYLKAHVVKANQALAAVGYSMGAIVLNNYASTFGSECALDVAFTISGAMECRREAFNERAKRLWLPMVTEITRLSQVVEKWANRLSHRLSRKDMIALLRSRNVVEADQYSAVTYNGYRDIMHYYAESGALGDVPWEHRELPFENLKQKPKLSKLAIPLGVLQAFDDPISTVFTIVGNAGFMQPQSLVSMGEGNLVLLLTQRAGHVGWPVGWLPWRRKWEFMSEAAISFVEAFAQACTESTGQRKSSDGV